MILWWFFVSDVTGKGWLRILTVTVSFVFFCMEHFPEMFFVKTDISCLHYHRKILFRLVCDNRLLYRNCYKYFRKWLFRLLKYFPFVYKWSNWILSVCLIVQEHRLEPLHFRPNIISFWHKSLIKTKKRRTSKDRHHLENTVITVRRIITVELLHLLAGRLNLSVWEQEL